jgi:hypothetical protein
MRVLNLNAPAAKICAWIGVFLVVIPGLLYLVELVDLSGSLLPWLSLATHASWITGGLLLGGFILLIILEQIQDKLLTDRYHKNRHRKLKIATDRYECQYCGNREVKEADKTCRICGKDLI